MDIPAIRRKVIIGFRRVPSSVWRLGFLAFLIGAGVFAWHHPVSHRWLALELGIEAAEAQGMATVPAGSAEVILAERVADLEGMVRALEKARTADVETMQALRGDYQAALAEVAAAHDELVKQSGQIAKLGKTSGSVGVSGGTSVGTPSASSPSPQPTPKKGGKVNINTASAAELDELPGIGPSYAQKIVEYREANGAFSSVDELDEVSGIGPATLDKIRDLVEI